MCGYCVDGVIWPREQFVLEGGDFDAMDEFVYWRLMEARKRGGNVVIECARHLACSLPCSLHQVQSAFCCGIVPSGEIPESFSRAAYIALLSLRQSFCDLLPALPKWLGLSLKCRIVDLTRKEANDMHVFWTATALPDVLISKLIALEVWCSSGFYGLRRDTNGTPIPTDTNASQTHHTSSGASGDSPLRGG